MLKRRLKKLLIDEELFLGILKNGITEPVRVVNPLPDDARIAQVTWDREWSRISLIFESDSFPEIGVDDAVPFMTVPRFERVSDKVA